MSLFLERRSYRLRRLMDAVRLLPILGLGLWMIPLMWQTPSAGEAEAGGVPMSRALVYVFGVWLMLIAATLVLWWRTKGGTDASGNR